MTLIVLISACISIAAVSLAYATGDPRGVWYFVAGVWQPVIWILLLRLWKRVFVELRAMHDDCCDLFDSDDD